LTGRRSSPSPNPAELTSKSSDRTVRRGGSAEGNYHAYPQWVVQRTIKFEPQTNPTEPKLMRPDERNPVTTTADGPS